ncbi:hypothetical protein, partial [Paenibacillus alba]
ASLPFRQAHYFKPASLCHSSLNPQPLHLQYGRYGGGLTKSLPQGNLWGMLFNQTFYLLRLFYLKSPNR